MRAWGWWDSSWGPAHYVVIAHCGSSCNHYILRRLTAEEIAHTDFDIFAFLARQCEAAFDNRHDSAPYDAPRMKGN